MDVGRIRFNVDAKRGKSFILMKVTGDRDNEVFPPKSGGGVAGGCRQHVKKSGSTLSCGPNRLILRPIILNNGL